MIKKRAGLFFIILMIYELVGCAMAGPRPPLPGPNPGLDRILVYLQYFTPFIIFIIFSAFLGLGIYLFLVKKTFFHKITENNTPVEIAGERYARGELSREEYIQIIKDLKFMDEEEKILDEYKDL